MKRFIIIVSIVIALYLIVDTAYYRMGVYVDLDPYEPVSTFIKAQDDKIYLDRGNGFEEFEIKGVNMGSGIPGKWSTEFAIDKETYKRWFKYIQEMGANTVRIYTIQEDNFYDAFYEYNLNNDDPLWLIHGVWVNDYIQNSRRDAYDPDFFDDFKTNCKTMIDVVHGNKKIALGTLQSAGSGVYRKDISQWVLGYILGVEWEDVTVVYTDELYDQEEAYTSYTGKYMYTSEESTPFECMLACVGDNTIEYETTRYKQQHIVAFSNWPTTDPFDYPEEVANFFMKCADVDVEHILCTEDFLSGQFVSYHIYPYYPDYLSYVEDWARYGLDDKNDFYTDDGKLNTYRAYLTMVKKHHTMPVVISEFGVSTGRGMAQRDMNTGRNQGNTSEKEQGKALTECYYDIKAAGCCGCCIFTWQDEWFKRTWNTMYAVNLRRNPYWSDYQTNEQYFGLLSFDPGNEESICYVDGDVSEWSNDDIVGKTDDYTLSMKYDEKFVYFMIEKKGFDINKDILYIPIDTTPKTGSSYCSNYNLLFDRAADFIIAVDGKDNTRIQVQERYEALRANYSENINKYNTYLSQNIPEKDSPLFVNIDMILQTATPLISHDPLAPAEVFETGKLKYGNANPHDRDFESLNDFCSSGDYLEIKLPWQILNFSDPSDMEIHDDYYDDNYGVFDLNIDAMYVGVTSGGKDRCIMSEFKLRGWDRNVTYHERLKDSYYVMQKLWKEDK